MVTRAAKPLHILIVENEVLVAEDIKDILEGAGHRVVGIATTISEALTLAEKFEPQLAFLDVDLGNGESGLDAADWLARDFRVPAIFLTGRTDFHARAMALDGEPLGFVSKPYLPDDIIKAADLAG